MTNRPIHFEIQVDDVERAKSFYSEVFGWSYQDMTQTAGDYYSEYWAVITGPDDAPGISGGLFPRKGDAPAADQTAAAFVCTMVVDHFDIMTEKILNNGGSVVERKFALPGMAWQGYYRDTEGNIFGIHTPDKTAGVESTPDKPAPIADVES